MQKIIASTAKIVKKINLLILLVEILHVLVDLCLAKGVLILSTLKKCLSGKKHYVWNKTIIIVIAVIVKWPNKLSF